MSPRVYIFTLVFLVSCDTGLHILDALVVYKRHWTSVSLLYSEVCWRWLLRRLAVCPYTACPLFLLLAYVHSFLSDISNWSLGFKKQSIWKISGIQGTRYTSICTLVFMRLTFHMAKVFLKI